VSGVFHLRWWRCVYLCCFLRSLHLPSYVCMNVVDVILYKLMIDLRDLVIVSVGDRSLGDRRSWAKTLISHGRFRNPHYPSTLASSFPLCTTSFVPILTHPSDITPIPRFRVDNELRDSAPSQLPRLLRSSHSFGHFCEGLPIHCRRDPTSRCMHHQPPRTLRSYDLAIIQPALLARPRRCL